MQMQGLEKRRDSRSSSAVAVEEEEEGLMGSKNAITFPYTPPSKRSRSYRKMLLFALAIASVFLLVNHGLKERRVLTLLLEEREKELNSLHTLLQKESENSEELKMRIEEMKETAVSLRSQKKELTQKLEEAKNIASYLKERETELESAQEESKRKIKMLRAIEFEFAKTKTQVKTLKRLLQRQGDEFEALKHRFASLSSKPENVTVVCSENPSNKTLQSDTVEDGKPQGDEDAIKEENLKDEKPRGDEEAIEEVNLKDEKLMQNETIYSNGTEQHDANPKIEKWVKLETNSESDLGSKENVEKEATQLKKVETSEDERMNLENEERTGNQTTSKVDSLLVEDLSNRQEQRNFTITEPEMSGNSSLGEKPTLANEDEKDLKNGLKLPSEHANPNKRNRRRHRLLPRTRMAWSNENGQQSKVEENGGHLDDLKRSERMDVTFEDVLQQEKNRTSKLGNMNADSTAIKPLIKSDDKEVIGLSRGNETSQVNNEDLQTLNEDEKNEERQGNEKIVRSLVDTNGTSLLPTMFKLPTGENGNEHVLPLNLTGTRV